MTPPDDPLDRLHRDLGFKQLNLLWAKLEILLGLIALAGGVLSGMKVAVTPEALVTQWDRLAPLLLMILGGYLALAGHRSLLYQSNNRLAAHLADLIRKHQPPPPGNPS